MFGVEGRYAHALYSAASKKNSLDKVEKELNDFQVRSVCYCINGIVRVLLLAISN